MLPVWAIRDEEKATIARINNNFFITKKLRGRNNTSETADEEYEHQGKKSIDELA